MSSPWIKITTNIFRRGRKYYFTRQVNKERKFIPFEAQTDAEAIILGADLLNDPLHSGKCLEAEIVQCVAHKIKEGEWRETTSSGHSYVLPAFSKYFNGHVASSASIDSTALQGWYDHEAGRDISDSTLVTHWAIIRSFFRWAHKDARIIPSNPCLQVRTKPYEHKPRTEHYNWNERQTLLTTAAVLRKDADGNDTSALDHPNCAVITTLALNAGLRKNEIDNARPEWIDMVHRRIHVQNLDSRQAAALDLDPFKTKGGKERFIPMSTPLFEFFQKHPPQSPYLVEPKKRHKTPGKKNKYRYDVRRPYSDLLEKAKVRPLPFHCTRHTFATLLLSSGKCTIYQVAKWLGDTLKTTENTYGHIIPQFDQMDAGFTDPAQARLPSAIPVTPQTPNGVPLP